MPLQSYSLSAAELTARLMERAFSARVSDVLLEFREYLTRERTWCSAHAAPFLKSPVAYFSAEFAIHESLPIYSGGLGVLAGDHAKSASDLGVPLVGISLFYRQGYFQRSPPWLARRTHPLLDRHDLPVDLVEGRRKSLDLVGGTAAYTREVSGLAPERRLNGDVSAGHRADRKRGPLPRLNQSSVRRGHRHSDCPRNHYGYRRSSVVARSQHHSGRVSHE
jgi:glucan phosphorylase